MTVYLVVGPTGAGKTTVLNHLRQQGMAGIETSDYVKKLLRQHHCQDAYELTEKLGLAETGRQVAHDADEQLAATAVKTKTPPGELEAAVGGVRIMSTVRHFAAHTLYSVEFIGLDATDELCFAQHHAQGRNREKYSTIKEFVERKLEPDYRLGLRDIMACVPAHRRIKVTGDMQELLANVDALTRAQVR